MTRLHVKNLSAAGLALGLWLTGCADAPARVSDAIAERVLAEMQPSEIGHARWQAAEPGCEGANTTTLELALCEGQPELGALLTTEGTVVCVDSLDLLLEELGTGKPDAADPTPQPSHPGGPADVPISHDLGGQASFAYSADGDFEDPTPTPAIRMDPTPTPATQADLTSLLALGGEVRGGDEEDPTPTTATEP